MPVLFVSIVLDLVGFGIILPLLPFYALHYGASPLLVTLLSATFSLTQFAAAPVWGWLSDRFGRRPIFLFCLALSALAYLALAFAPTLTVLFLARAASGMAAGKVSVAQAIAADISAPERRARAMGLMSSAFGIGMILGPALGGLLAGDAANPNYQLPALVAALASAVALGFAYFTVPESLPPERRAARTRGRTGLRPILSQPQVGALVLLSFVIYFVFSQLESIFPLWLESGFGWGPAEVGLFFTFIGVNVAATQALLIGPLVHRFSERRIMLTGMAMLSAGLLFTPFIVNLPLLALNTILTTQGFALLTPTLMALVSRAALPVWQGATLGVVSAAGALGRVFGPGIAGWQFEVFGRNVPYVTAGALLLATCVVAALFVAKGAKEEVAHREAAE